jgi:biotin transport system ATP-binding protein
MITTENLTHRYGDVTAVDDVSLTIADGSFVVLAGANGSGKTTLVQQFNGLLAPDEGSVTVDGRDVTEHPVAARTSVGMVFQRPRDQFVAATVGADVAFGPENLGLERAEIDRRVETALAAVNMAGRETDRIESLSGGEQARVAIAGTLAMEPSHLVLDEPFAGLDQPARESVLAHLDDLHEAGTGIVVVTHDLRDLLDRAERLLAMRDGALVVDASPENAATALADVDVRVPAC